MEPVLNAIGLVILAARVFVLVPPLAVAYLAIRRLMLSRSKNAWLYAITAVIALVVIAGLAPWVFAADTTEPRLIAAALALPPLWLAIVLYAGPGKGRPYDPDQVAREPEHRQPLLLSDPITSSVTPPVFRHRKARHILPEYAPPDMSGSVLAAARGMRGHATSDRRRPKALPPPPPSLDVPFLKS